MQTCDLVQECTWKTFQVENLGDELIWADAEQAGKTEESCRINRKAAWWDLGPEIRWTVLAKDEFPTFLFLWSEYKNTKGVEIGISNVASF